MTHRQWKTVLLLSTLAGVFVLSPLLLGEEKGEVDRTNPSKIIAKKLRTPNLPNYQDIPLGKAIEDIAKKADVKITFDPKGLADEGITEETPIRLTTKHEIMLKSTLNLILIPLHLEYEIKDDGIVICSESQLDARIVKCKYDIADVAASPTELKNIVAEMRALVERGTPKETFKEDSIVVSKDGKQVIVEQVRGVHSSLREFIMGLRHAKDQKERDQIYDGWVKIADYRYDSDK
jgi:hypothetical protein